jgi:hypothetical protein
MATSAPGTGPVTGTVEAVGVTTEDPTLHAQHAEAPVGTTPAPDATPDGALAYFTADDGSDAWLTSEDTGTEAAADPANAAPSGGTTPDATVDTGDPAAVNTPAPTTQGLTGYLRRVNADPVRYDTVEQWASDVDALGMQEAPVPTQEPDPGNPAAQPTTPAAPAGPAPAPAVAVPAGKGKMPPQFAGHQFGSGGKKPSGGGNPQQDGGGDKPPAIDRGSFVQVGSLRGRVDLIVTNGKVPGVDGDVEGTTDSPAARVVVWEKDGSGYKASARKIGVSVARAKRIAPLQSSKALAALERVEDLHMAHEALIEAKELPERATVGPDAVKVAFERGIRSWPGYDDAGCGPEDWGVGRVEAFLATAAGFRPDGYHRDDDLLTAQ